MAKTQLTLIALSAGYDRVKVFSGAIFGFILVTGIGILIGEALFMYISPSWSWRWSGIYPVWDIVFGRILKALADLMLI